MKRWLSLGAGVCLMFVSACSGKTDETESVSGYGGDSGFWGDDDASTGIGSGVTTGSIDASTDDDASIETDGGVISDDDASAFGDATTPSHDGGCAPPPPPPPCCCGSDDAAVP